MPEPTLLDEVQTKIAIENYLTKLLDVPDNQRVIVYIGFWVDSDSKSVVFTYDILDRPTVEDEDGNQD